MGHSGRGSVFCVLWATVGGLGLPGNLVSLRETVAGLVAVYFNFNFNLFILYHIHQYHEYILDTFTYIFIVRRRIQGPI